MRTSSAITITASGGNLTTSAVSASTTIPNDAAGNRPRFLRVAAAQPAYVKLGVGSATATSSDTMVQPGDALILSVGGCTHIAVLQVSAAGPVQFSPLDDVH